MLQMTNCEIGKHTHIEGILPKGPYLPCVSMAGRALLAGYPRCHVYACTQVHFMDNTFILRNTTPTKCTNCKTEEIHFPRFINSAPFILCMTRPCWQSLFISGLTWQQRAIDHGRHRQHIEDHTKGCITLRPRQNDRHFPDGIFKCIFLNINFD